MDDLDIALAAARTGAEIVRRAFATGIAAEYKARHDPVTEVDRASEAAITGVIRAHRPDDGILAEEGSGSAVRGRRWIIDPLDGTVNFVHGIPQVSVSVALWDDATPLVGVVVDALRAEEFAAASGRGATLDGTPMHVSQMSTLDTAVVATGFPYDHSTHASAYVAGVQAVLERVNGIRRLGSAALDLAWVAAGRYEAYWEMQVAPWDMAAGVVLVREAGGEVTDPAGRPVLPRPGPILSSNGLVHAGMVALLSPHIPDHLR
jgi:myo-inositol-1(or 4)-monophosphatase